MREPMIRSCQGGGGVPYTIRSFSYNVNSKFSLQH